MKVYLRSPSVTGAYACDIAPAAKKRTHGASDPAEASGHACIGQRAAIGTKTMSETLEKRCLPLTWPSFHPPPSNIVSLASPAQRSDPGKSPLRWGPISERRHTSGAPAALALMCWDGVSLISHTIHGKGKQYNFIAGTNLE